MGRLAGDYRETSGRLTEDHKERAGWHRKISVPKVTINQGLQKTDTRN